MFRDGVKGSEFQRADGSWVRIDYYKLETGGTFVVTADITARKQADRALHLAQVTLDHAGEAIFWIGPDAHFKYVNDHARKVLGYSAEDFATMKIFDVDPEITEENWGRAWDRIKAESPYTFETVHRCKDGRDITFEVSMFFLQYGNTEFACSFSRDITQRKKAEATIKRAHDELERLGQFAEQRYRNIVDGSIQGILVLRENRPLFANQAWADIHGYDSADEIFALGSIEPTIAPAERDRVKRYGETLMAGGDIPAPG